MPENRKKAGKRKPNAGSFKPGQTGNAGGRPKLTAAEREAKEARALARPSAVAVLVSIMEDPEAPSKDRVSAAKAILDGLEPLKLEMSGKDGAPFQSVPVVTITPTEALARLEGLKAAGALEENAAPTKEQE